MKVLCISDPHVADPSQRPSKCTETYTDDLFDLLEQAREFAVHCDIVAISGDVFHKKAPTRNSHGLVLRVIRALRQFGKPVYVVPGNHDLQNDRLESLREGQPLGVVIVSGAARYLSGWARGEYGWPVYGVPWLQHWTDDAVSAALAEYRPFATDPAAEFAATPDPPPRLVVTHAPLYPPGKELSFEHYPAEKFAAAMGGRGWVFYGHVHEPHGVWQCGGVTFCNNGALSRGSLHEYNLDRQVGVTVWDSDTGVFDFVPLRAKPASEVFRLAEHEQETGDKQRLEEFLAGIVQANLGVVSTESVLEHIRGQEGVTAAEAALCEELLEGASNG